MTGLVIFFSIYFYIAFTIFFTFLARFRMVNALLVFLSCITLTPLAGLLLILIANNATSMELLRTNNGIIYCVIYNAKRGTSKIRTLKEE